MVCPFGHTIFMLNSVVSQPPVVTIPFHGYLHAALQIVLRTVAQFLDGRGDVAPPVALTHYVVFVVVEGCHLACDSAYAVANHCYNAQQPYRCFYSDEPRVAELTLYQVAECP